MTFLYLYLDPWAYHQQTHHFSELEKVQYHTKTVTYIEALGNAALDQSFEHIRSYTNASTTPSVLKRAGLRSFRGYHPDKVSTSFAYHSCVPSQAKL